MNDKIDNIKYVLDKQIYWINSADSKTIPVLGINTFLLGAVVAILPRIQTWDHFLVINCILGTIPLSLSIIFLFFTISPKTKCSQKSLIYFGTIIDYNKEDYIEKLCKIDDNDYVNDLSNQCYTNAKIANSKHMNLRYSIFSLFLSFIPLLLFFTKLQL
jgi:hypothetical protein